MSDSSASINHYILNQGQELSEVKKYSFKSFSLTSLTSRIGSHSDTGILNPP